MKTITAIYFVFLLIYPTSIAFGQASEFDTVFVKRTVGIHDYVIDTLYISGGRNTTQVLAGTTFLPYSDHMIGLLSYGISPISFDLLEECNNTINPDSFKEYPKFISSSREGDTLTIVVSVIANCCHQFLGEAEVQQDTLHLLYISYGGFCSCECCFTLRYRFDMSMEDSQKGVKHVRLNKSSLPGFIGKKDSAIFHINRLFCNYISQRESTDSYENKALMSKSLQSISKLHKRDELLLLIHVWMYYDPTDYTEISEVIRILMSSKPESIEAVKYRIKHKRKWESRKTAPYSDLKRLLYQLEQEK
jgi:hypothetical protein